MYHIKEQNKATVKGQLSTEQIKLEIENNMNTLLEATEMAKQAAHDTLAILEEIKV